jgi:beta-galactosidase
MGKSSSMKISVGWLGRGAWMGLAMIVVTAITAFAAPPPRERLLLDFDWKFRLGDDWGTGEKLDKAGDSVGPAKADFNDVAWRAVKLPHDWAVELSFDQTADGAHGFKPIGPGFGTNNIGWYRRTFALSAADAGKRVWLEFDGVARDCRVFVNGYRLARHESGFSSFRCDITDVANFDGKNTLVVRVDASQFEGWFYEGAGIYRHVWLLKTAPLAIAPDGTFVFSRFNNNGRSSGRESAPSESGEGVRADARRLLQDSELPQGAAEIHVQTRLSNSQNKPVSATVKCRVIDAAGKEVAATQRAVKLDTWGDDEFSQTTQLASPKLWSPESPTLYTLETTVESDGLVVDFTKTAFGVRTFAFDANQGFLLNGKPYVIKGTCNHQDHAGVGVAVPDALQYFRVAKLKEMGANAFRTSHNPPTPKLLEACDRLGMLVMDESRLLGSDAQNLKLLEEFIRRDRNHASVFVWSIANEEVVQRDESAARIASTMQRLVHRLDPTRQCTAAMNSWSSEAADGISTVIDVQGFNYINNGEPDAFHQNNPKTPIIGTEEASAFSTRGIYENTKTYRSAYDDHKPSYGATAEEWWKYFSARPWLSGSFIWTGFDYRGEPSPFGWPNISSHFGALDTCGFPKDSFYYYQSWWSDKTVLHLLPHWNWPGQAGQELDVRCFSNCDEVELFFNGKSLGKQSMPRNSYLRWKVKYAPGTLAAKGYKGGRVIVEEKVETTGEPAAIKLLADLAGREHRWGERPREPNRPDGKRLARTLAPPVEISADGEDLSVLTVAVTDAQGRIVPTATNLVTLALSGPGEIIGVGNGDPICHEPDVIARNPSSHSVMVDDWRMKLTTNLNHRAEIAAPSGGDWSKVDIRSSHGPLQSGESAVFQARLNVSAADLVADVALLQFGMIDDDGWIYVNGELMGESHDWRASPAFDIRKALRSGENTIHVVVKNSDSAGGLSKGATLEFLTDPDALGWQRSVFNGLAQVIVQAGKETGEITLRVQSPGLKDGSIVINATRSPARPAAPSWPLPAREISTARN